MRLYYLGYKAPVTKGVTKVSCLAHSPRKFFDLWANHKSDKSGIAEEATELFALRLEAIRFCRLNPLEVHRRPPRLSGHVSTNSSAAGGYCPCTYGSPAHAGTDPSAPTTECP